ncbi:hypothetical protein BJ742DRAFT_848816 [Cladochytrium replicatum]|nr:hypothetical protein BJ742DRAFT_848816 [Cladochytrium replicatum]
MKLIATAFVVSSLVSWAVGLSAPTNLPAEVTPPTGSKYITSLYAVGTQNYVCKDGKWVFSRPVASLYKVGTDPYNKTTKARRVGDHYFWDTPMPDATTGGRATWELKYREQIVTTKVWHTKDSPSPLFNIAWLLTNTTYYKGPKRGVFASVGHVVRADTRFGVGGGAPDNCTNGSEAKQPYSALYHYYTKIGVPVPDAPISDDDDDDD